MSHYHCGEGRLSPEYRKRELGPVWKTLTELVVPYLLHCDTLKVLVQFFMTVS